MNIEEFRDYCLSKKGVTEGFPFDESTLVFKVIDKMFALTDTVQNDRANLKCDPEKAVELREEYPETVLPGYHMSKKHWNTVLFNGRVSDREILEWTDESYNLVVAKLKKADKEKLNSL